jgi:hypothetical protein
MPRLYLTREEREEIVRCLLASGAPQELIEKVSPKPSQFKDSQRHRRAEEFSALIKRAVMVEMERERHPELLDDALFATVAEELGLDASTVRRQYRDVAHGLGSDGEERSKLTLSRGQTALRKLIAVARMHGIIFGIK